MNVQAQQHADDPLNEFRTFLQQTGFFGKLALLAPGLPPLVPVMAALADMGPLWPRGSVWITTLLAPGCMAVEYIVYIVCFSWLSHKTEKALQSWLASFIAASLFLGICLISFSYIFVYPIKGWGYTDEAMKYADQDIDEVLKIFLYKVDAIWTYTHLAVMRLGLLSFWVLGFIALTFTFTVFVLQQRRRSTPKGRRHKSLSGVVDKTT
jgi:hypothetical protein